VNYKTITPPIVLNPQSYGCRVQLSGNFMIIGAASENDHGAAYMYNILQF